MLPQRLEREEFVRQVSNVREIGEIFWSGIERAIWSASDAPISVFLPSWVSIFPWDVRKSFRIGDVLDARRDLLSLMGGRLTVFPAGAVLVSPNGTVLKVVGLNR